MRNIGARLFWCVYVGAMVAIMAVLLVGCSNPHKNEHCVSSHREVAYYQHTKVTSWYSITEPVYRNVCDQWVPNT